jgi:hypothetical protein
MKAKAGIKILGEKIFEKLLTISSKNPKVARILTKIVIKTTIIRTSRVSDAESVIHKFFRRSKKLNPLRIPRKIAEIKIERPRFSFKIISTPSNKIADKRIIKSII